MQQKNTILNYNSADAKKFFLQGNKYCNIQLPEYFCFDNLLNSINEFLNQKDIKIKKASKYDNVCYKLYVNKGENYTWRMLQIIHPVLYCSLVNIITKENNWKILKEKFKTFQKIENISCFSIPIEDTNEKKKNYTAEIIKNWWNKFEQQTIELSLEYKYMLNTDIADCYSSIYTHSLEWALFGKEKSKNRLNKDKSNQHLDEEDYKLAQDIDNHIQYMQYGQTNGIPQGSILMDFIAEIILGYIDKELNNKISNNNDNNDNNNNNNKIIDYKILRYRDDYRIFSNKQENIEIISKYLAEVLSENGLKINSSKTFITSDIITNSIKPDKLYYIKNIPIYTKKNNSLFFDNIQQELIFIYDLANKYPNSGTVKKLLDKLYEKLHKKLNHKQESIKILIAIVANIAYKNNIVFPTAIAIISKLLTQILDNKEKKDLIEKIKSNVDKISNSEIMQIWLQRLSKSIKDYDIKYTSKICNIVDDNQKEPTTYNKLWNSDWIQNKGIKKDIDKNSFINKQILTKLSEEIKPSEVSIFNNSYPF